MVNGEMQCLGSVQHLKHKYAQGFSLTVKLSPPAKPPTADVNLLNSRMNQPVKRPPQPIKSQFGPPANPTYGPPTQNPPQPSPDNPQTGSQALTLSDEGVTYSDQLGEAALKLHEEIMTRFIPCTLKDEHKVSHNMHYFWP